MKPRKEIIVIDDLAPHPKYGAGCCRAADIYQALIDQGFNVTLYLQAPRAADKEVFDAGHGCSRIRYVKNIELPQLIKNLGPNLTHIWVSRTRNVAAFRDILLAWKNEVPSRRYLISDTEALTSLRPLSFRIELQSPKNRQTCVAAAREELSHSQGFDTVVCVSDFEAELATEALPGVRIHKLESVFSPKCDTPPHDKREHFFFCGAFHTDQTPNTDSVQWFCNRVWPHIKAALPEAQFHIGGFVGKDVILPEVVRLNARILGPIEDLQLHYNRYRVFVAPTRVAAGVPYKVRHAMSSGIPCVITELLAKQMPHPENTRPFVSSPIEAKEFAQHCINLYSNKNAWHETQQAALTEIDRACAPNIFDTALSAILRGR
ncbi:glycosyltransferase [Kordiimonas sp.]|uniref:glycosyltransferase n=1 Tax=Kordiimonas sp. TaxID=1970157 RepID=UPI003A90E726